MPITISEATARRAASAAFRSMERVAPPLAGRTAAHLFFYVGRPPTEAKRRKHEPANGTPFEVLAGGNTVRGMTYGPTDGLPVYLVHGWAGWWQQLSAMVEPLVASGHRVIGFDSLAHGASDGGQLGQHRSAAPEMAQSFAAVAAEHGRPHGVVAHSLGALAALWSAHEEHTLARRYAFYAPGVTAETLVNVFMARSGFTERTMPRMLRRFERLMGRPLADYDGREAVAGLDALHGLPPLLVAHDDGDPDVPLASSRQLVAEWEGAELIETSGLGHTRIMYRPDLAARMAAFIAEG